MASQRPGLAILRANTLAFIRDDQMTIQLVPRARITQVDGGFKLTDQPARVPQVFRLLSQADGRERQVSETGLSFTYPYVLLCPYDAVIAPDDYWVGDDGQRYTVDSMVNDNGYEKKAMVTANGKQ